MPLSIETSLLFIVLLAFVLIKSANLVVSAIHAIAAQAHIRMYGLAAFLVALSTSFPEMLVAVSSAVSGHASISLGNVMGSNIANISLILGLAAVGGGSVRAASKYINTDIFYVFLIGTLPALLLIDGTLSKLESIGLVLAYLLYAAITLSKKKTKPTKNAPQDHWRRMLFATTDSRFEKSVTLLIVGMAGMILSANTMVKLAVNISTQAQVPVFLIGLLVMAIGTSIPELAFELAAIKHRESQLAFDNIFGSVVANSTLILGLTGIIHPIVLGQETKPYLVSVMGFVAIFGLFWWFVKTKHRLDRWEGGMLVLAYAIFAYIQYWMR